MEREKRRESDRVRERERERDRERGRGREREKVREREGKRGRREVRSSHGHRLSHTRTQVPLNFDDDNLPSPSGSVPSTPTHATSTHLPTRLHLYNSLEVAQELSILDGELLRKIDPEELRNGAWMKKNKVGHP